MAVLGVERVGLRTRVSLTFALGAALLAALMSLTTYGLVRENLLSNVEEGAIDQVSRNAQFVRTSLGRDANIETILSSVQTSEGGYPVLLYQSGWAARDSVQFGQSALPTELVTRVTEGEAARFRFVHDGEPYLVVGIPVPAVQAAYYEAVPLQSVQETLDGLAFALLGAAAITTVLGGVLGFWVSRRSLRPLVEVGAAAEAIAGGRLETRLESRGDPDLTPLTDSFNRMVSALEERIDRDARFASEVSHELRSPLMTLAASVEVLDNSRDELPPRAQMALDLLKADVDRFQQLVEDLLEISRFDVGAITLHLQQVLLPEIVIAGVHAAGAGPVPVVYEEDAAELVVRVDKVRFSRVLANLLDNAVKYAGGATRVLVESVDGDEPPGSGDQPGTTPRWARVVVEDEGPGVPDDEKASIFGRFSRGSESGKRASDSGVGLGLALVDEHLRLHGGRVWVEDRADGRSGARFVIELPVVALDDEEPFTDEELELVP